MDSKIGCMITSFMLQNCMSVSCHEYVNEYVTFERTKKQKCMYLGRLRIFAVRCLPEWTEMGKKSKWTTRIDLNINVDRIRAGWPSIVTESI